MGKAGTKKNWSVDEGAKEGGGRLGEGSAKRVAEVLDGRMRVTAWREVEKKRRDGEEEAGGRGGGRKNLAEGWLWRMGKGYLVQSSCLQPYIGFANLLEFFGYSHSLPHMRMYFLK